MAAGRVIQVALCSSDLSVSIRRYAKVFGFADAGGLVLWGSRVARIQRLGEDMTGSLRWMVGRQELVQLEFFQHSLPAQRPLPHDWRPCDHGWVRFGVSVPDFDDTLGRLSAEGVPLLGGPLTVAGCRRACFRDPELGIVVELLEDTPQLPGGPRRRHFELAPAIVYVTLSVPDLEPARQLYLGAFQMPEWEGVLHDERSESSWGLAGAQLGRFVADGGGVLLEVVSYRSPAGRPLPEGHLLSDQGFMNVAVGYRRRPELEEAVERALAAGAVLNMALPDRPATSMYLTDAQGFSVEVLCMPPEFEPEYGFQPRRVFPPPQTWPATPVPPAPPD